MLQLYDGNNALCDEYGLFYRLALKAMTVLGVEDVVWDEAEEEEAAAQLPLDDDDDDDRRRRRRRTLHLCALKMQDAMF